MKTFHVKREKETLRKKERIIEEARVCTELGEVRDARSRER